MRAALLLLLLTMGGCAATQPLTLPPQRSVCPPVAPEAPCPPLPAYDERTFVDTWADAMVAHGVCKESLQVWRDAWEQCHAD